MSEARALFESLLTRKPFDVRLLTNLAFVALNQGRLRAAERYLVQALAYHPDDAQALENMVLVQVVKGNQIAAQRYGERLARQHPDHPQLDQLRRQWQAL